MEPLHPVISSAEGQLNLNPRFDRAVIHQIKLIISQALCETPCETQKVSIMPAGKHQE